MQKSKNKQAVSSSQHQSMLISQRKPDQSNIIKAPTTNYTHACECSNRMTKVQSKIEMLGLRLEEIASNLNISFTKHMEMHGRVVEEQKKIEHVQFAVWEVKEVQRAISEKIQKDINKNHQEMENLGEEVKSWARLLRELKNWKNSQINWSSQIEKDLYDTLKQHRSDNETKIKKMYEVVQQIGLLQRKMLENKENFHQKKSIPKKTNCNIDPRKSLPLKSNTYLNESTMLGLSRNYLN